ncbi:hypothetical protein GCM10027036_28390 [Flavihumibacter cheonanensis]|uniref:hypothetical protein n=1 Tax=Flavihumibacter cheonanensis TaxID=1442385 RepID=UPI001EF7B605|nr:hypothetical protein [Flavihumibacter cheonanensis]MCG7753138.1 hypothetical protein [Flavihumibacter cheonanensis]
MLGDSGQVATPVQSAQLLFCCKQIERRYGNKQVGEWTNRDYIYLSHTISHETNILISPNTLKRIFGKIHTNSHYFPQQATRDALAKFSGYSDWAAMVEQIPQPVLPTKEDTLTEPGESVDKDVILRKRAVVTTHQQLPAEQEMKKSRFAFWWAYRKWIFGLIGVLVLLAFSLFLQKMKDDRILQGSVRLLCLNPEGANPHTALFKLQTEQEEMTTSGGFSIDFNDGKSKRAIQPGELLNHYFEMPGVYYPILYYNNQPIDTSRVSLQSNEWTATASILRDTTRVYPISADDIRQNDNLQVTPPALFASGIDTNKTFLVSFYRGDSSGKSGDNFKLTIKLKTSRDRPGVRCSQVWTKIFGDQYYHEVLILKPGCTNWSTVGFSEKRFYGGSSDLRSLGVDLSDGGEIQILVKDKKAAVYTNGKQIFTTNYAKSIGTIQGIGINFSGTGSIEQVELTEMQ